MIDFFSKPLSYITSSITLIQGWVYGSPQHLTNSINFDVKTLCPKELTATKREKWIASYLEQCEGDTLLLWADEKDQLNATYRKKTKIRHLTLPEYEVDASSQGIFQDGQIISSLKNIVQALGLSHITNIPEASKLLEYKDQVYLQRKKITPEMLQKIFRKTEQGKHNLESSSECPICQDNYDDSNPPYILTDSGHVYHRECILNYFETKDHPTCPISNKTIERPIQLIPDLAYKSLMNEANEFTIHLDQMKQMLTILQAKNEKLERKLEDVKTSQDSASEKRLFP